MKPCAPSRYTPSAAPYAVCERDPEQEPGMEIEAKPFNDLDVSHPALQLLRLRVDAGRVDVVAG